MVKPYSYCVVILVSLLLSASSSSKDAIWGDSASGYCCGAEIRIYQWPSGFTALGVPKYSVLIVNEAWGAPSGVFDVHISCGEFASASLINPLLFRRVAVDDCLLKNGKLLYPGEVISFHYANILPYNLTVVQVRC
ncbi:hypothetical protein RHMOL_Rhmol12G0159900 [Rhododendron molle]|uniref:Uncharacterized protein n=1 Tax=Rhododendron molle TaxID=49168 RepID=A0ACC0LK01_RHOML|nr:hypothetical protein RHMOL_Rhmol12G0159900 [Rhododendron molle]